MKIFITRKIPNRGIDFLRAKGYEVVVNPRDQVLSKSELVEVLKQDRYDAVLCLLFLTPPASNAKFSRTTR